MPLERQLRLVGLAVLGKNKMQRLFRALDIPRQRNVRRLEPEIHRLLIGFEILQNGVIAFDLQFVKNLPAGIFFADAGTSILKRFK